MSQRPSTSSFGSETDSFEEYKEFKKRKKSQSMKALVRKMESLEKKVTQLKEKNKKLEDMQRKPIYYDSTVAKPKARLLSNLISIKVQGQDHLKEDILKELRNIKSKVEILDNKSADHHTNITSPSSPLRNQYQTTNPTTQRM